MAGAPEGVDLAQPSAEEASGVRLASIVLDDLLTGKSEPRTIYANSVPVAWGAIDSVGGITEGFGVASVTRTPPGVYDVVLDNDTNSANTPVTITPFTIGFGIPEIAGYETTGANSFTIRIQDQTGTARDSAFTFVVWGQR